jgi:dimethylhistidine N-methyltransferase
MISEHVRDGLSRFPKRLPAYLFYDDVGSMLYEQIASLPEYYLTRTERSILEANAHDIIRRVRGEGGSQLTIVELGAGSATKTQLLLRVAVARQAGCLYVPADISATALDEATRRLENDVPNLTVRPFLGTHEEAFEVIRDLTPPVLSVFIGSSIGNYEDAEALELLAGLSGALDPTSWLLLGTDLRKSPARMLAAYDDSADVTASFNKNILTRINRELGGRFVLDRFRHTARWNEEASRVEMHLVSLDEQNVDIEALSMRVHFGVGESIHTESSVKYDEPRVHHLRARSGFEAHTTYADAKGLFAVHLARVSQMEATKRANGVAATRKPATPIGVSS